LEEGGNGKELWVEEQKEKLGVAGLVFQQCSWATRWEEHVYKGFSMTMDEVHSSSGAHFLLWKVRIMT
jgi:hypothetical protein